MSAKGKESTPAPTGLGTPAASADSTAPPVKVDKIDFPVHDGQSMVAAEPLPPSRLPSLIKRLNHAEASGVLRPMGYVDAESTTFALRVEGNGQRPVRITGMHAVAQCTAPLGGLLFYNPNAGEQSNPQLAFDLDQPDPTARGRGKDDHGDLAFTGDYFVNNEFTLTLGEAATFVVTATTRKHYCTFHLVLDLLVGGKPATEPIDNGGKPFTVSAGLGTRPDGTEIVYDYSRYAMALVSPIVPPYPPGDRTWRRARSGTSAG